MRKGWNEEWPKQDDIKRALNALNDTGFKRYLADFITQNPSSAQAIKTDLSKVQKIEALVQKGPTQKEDFATLTSLLIELIHLDDGSGSNIVGKAIGAILLDSKINSHFKKLA